MARLKRKEVKEVKTAKKEVKVEGKSLNVMGITKLPKSESGMCKE